MKGLPPDFSWEELLKAAAVFQGLFPEAVLVGGSAAALHAGHRVSGDTDYTLPSLPERFDDLLRFLEQREDWTTARVRRPVLILDTFRNVETGLRKLRRSAPLDTIEIETPYGRIRVPTPEEMIRVKAWLVLARNQTRDYLDLLAIAEKLGTERTLAALCDFDRYYADLYRPEANRDVSPLLQLGRQLAQPSPEDRDWMALSAYKGLQSPWTEWSNVEAAAQRLSAAIVEKKLGATPAT
jgi:hypothetical protein